MDGQRFDRMTRALAGTTSRRGLLKGIGGFIASAAGIAAVSDASAESPPKKCKYEGSNCRFDENCCSGNCCNRVCCADGHECCGGRCHEACPEGFERGATCGCVSVTVEDECAIDLDCAPSSNHCATMVCIDRSCVEQAVVCETSNPCQQASCDPDAGCTTASLPLGAICPGGTCDGAGACVPECAIVEDCSPTASPCLAPTCLNGTCGETPVASGTTCVVDGGGGVCDGYGNCVECLSQSECPFPTGVDPSCMVRSCIDGTCHYGTAREQERCFEVPYGYCQAGHCVAMPCQFSFQEGFCASGNERCCAGFCRNLRQDGDNCGFCGHECDTGLCLDGACFIS